ncbi:hypothetical protein BH09PSE1_BH09PSE1_24370 [soil metagenome]
MPALALKWRVSEHAIRKQITRQEATKRDHGDREAMAQAQAWEERAAEARAAEAADTPQARARALFDAGQADPLESGDPEELARQATQASGRAMRTGMWVEARALTTLAESYQRMATQVQGRASGTTETLPLQSVFDVRRPTTSGSRPGSTSTSVRAPGSPTGC